MNIKGLRKQNKMTQDDISKNIKISESYYSLIENCKRKPSVKVAKKLGEVFNIDWTLFFEEVEKMKYIQIRGCLRDIGIEQSDIARE